MDQPLGLACMAGYEFIAWLVLAAMVIGVTLARHRADDAGVEGSLILYLILFVTGVKPSEEAAIKSRGDDFRRYQRETSAFVPWFPRTSS